MRGGNHHAFAKLWIGIDLCPALPVVIPQHDFTNEPRQPRQVRVFGIQSIPHMAIKTLIGDLLRLALTKGQVDLSMLGNPSE